MEINLDDFNDYQCINTIDAHTEGEPLRIITSGYPEIKGDTILAKRAYLTEHLDHYRKLLMFEPRGHADMYGALITEPCSENADFGILFMHNEGYSSMCGHGIIAAVSVAIEAKAITMPAPGHYIGIDAPAGFIKAYAAYDENNKLNVSFDNVASFVEVLDQNVHVTGFGQVNVDIAFGGAYYAFVDADKLNLDCCPENQQALVNAGRAIKKAVMANYDIVHPLEQDLSFLYGVIFYSEKTDELSSHSRHVCVFADGEVDRSPTGTGVSARAAILAVKGYFSEKQLPYKQLPEKLLMDKQEVIIESIVGGKMTV
ncbi:MAG: proline racemase family protein, partial [Alteromonadaceae bacterium]|nr:proline racemase family protein [Alteromonadaceae bacterium]